jgi:hypothetical protein
MANNRLRFRCTVCKGTSPWIAKTMGGGWYVQPVWESTLAAVLNAFFNEHECCSVPAVGNLLAIGNIFRIEYEQTDVRLPRHDEPIPSPPLHLMIDPNRIPTT